jgi:hypothetical protein
MHHFALHPSHEMLSHATVRQPCVEGWLMDVEHDHLVRSPWRSYVPPSAPLFYQQQTSESQLRQIPQARCPLVSRQHTKSSLAATRTRRLVVPPRQLSNHMMAPTDVDILLRRRWDVCFCVGIHLARIIFTLLATTTRASLPLTTGAGRDATQ